MASVKTQSPDHVRGRVGLSVKPDSPQKGVQLGESIDAWLMDCRARGMRPGTVRRSYTQCTKGILLPFCERQGIGWVGELDQAALSKLAVELNERSLSKWTVAHYLRTINVYLGWAKAADRAPIPRTRKVPRNVLSLRELRQLEQAARSVRDQLIIRLLVDTGAREGEVVAMKLSDVLLHNAKPHVLLRGKTGTRYVGVSPELYARLKSYTSHQRPKTGSERLFLALRRSRVTKDFEPLTENGIYQVVTDTAFDAGWERKVYPHLLRHSAITRAKNEGLFPSDAAEIFGVSIAVISAHYAHSTSTDRHAAMMRTLMAPDDKA